MNCVADGTAAVKAAAAINYESVGTVEFPGRQTPQLLFHGNEHQHSGGTLRYRGRSITDLIRRTNSGKAGDRITGKNYYQTARH